MSEGVGNIGWQRQDTIYIVMYQSKRSGGTYTELRKTEAGLNRLVETLVFMGYNREDIIITEQQKRWMPEFKNNKRKGALRVGTGEQRIETPETHLHTGRGTAYLQ
jgi:hypothetical protein